MLRSLTPRAFERILSIGMYGSGKTYDCLMIAKRSQQTKSDAQFYVLNTDNSYGRMLLDDAFVGLENVHAVVPDGFRDYSAHLDKYLEIARPHDWIVLDLASYPWEAVQQEVSEARYGKDYADHLMDWAAQQTPGEKKGGPAFDRDIDWQTINGLYKGKFANKIVRAQCNVFAMSQAKPIDDKRETGAVKDLFGRHGVKPEGQKDLAYIFHTILLKTEGKNGAYRATTIRDKSRAKLEGAEIADFAVGYLVKVAGWKL